MDHSRIGVLGGVCALLLVLIALFLWVLTPMPSATKGQISDAHSSRASVSAAPADRDGEEATHEFNDLKASPVSPSAGVPDSPGALLPASSDSQQPEVSPGMSERHPLSRRLPGWLPPSSLDEAIVVPELQRGADVDFVNFGSDEYSRGLARHKRTYTYDPSNPDGVLELDLAALTFQGEFDKTLRYEVVVIRSRDRTSWRITNTGYYAVEMFIPVAEGDTFQVQLRTKDGHTALGYLPIPGTYGRGERNSRDLYRRGRVRLGLRLVAPVQEPRARRIQVNDAAGRPVPDAAVLQLGQEFGRADSMGLIDWPFPPPTPTGTDEVALEERGFMLSAPGYVPVFVPREDVADPRQPPLQITLKAREFVASVWGGTIDERVMCLAPNTYSENWYDNSEILAQGWDLLPLEPDAQVASWDDAFFYLTFSGYTREHLAELRQRPLDREITGLLQSVGQSRRRPRARPFSDGSGGTSHSSSWSDGLEAAIGRPYHGLWPDFYGGWYNGRWKYDAGRFDVVLPYPGKFLLLVGEEFREGMTGSKPGQINHVLYINALDPANVKGELFRCPG